VEVAGVSVADLRTLYRRARSGAAAARLIGETTIAGERAYELRFGPSSLARPEPLLVYLDRRTYLPLRAVRVRPALLREARFREALATPSPAFDQAPPAAAANARVAAALRHSADRVCPIAGGSCEHGCALPLAAAFGAGRGPGATDCGGAPATAGCALQISIEPLTPSQSSEAPCGQSALTPFRPRGPRALHASR
jgi:hypothetical protein